MLDAALGHIETAAHLTFAHRSGSGRRGPWGQHHAAVGLGRQLLLQQRCDPGAGSGVAGEQEGFQSRVVTLACQAHAAALAAACIDVVQGVRAFEIEERGDV